MANWSGLIRSLSKEGREERDTALRRQRRWVELRYELSHENENENGCQIRRLRHTHVGYRHSRTAANEKPVDVLMTVNQAHAHTTRIGKEYGNGQNWHRDKHGLKRTNEDCSPLGDGIRPRGCSMVVRGRSISGRISLASSKESEGRCVHIGIQ